MKKWGKKKNSIINKITGKEYYAFLKNAIKSINIKNKNCKKELGKFYLFT